MADLIDPVFHQSIAERLVDEERTWAVIQNTSKLSGADPARILARILNKKMIADGVSSRKVDARQYLFQYLHLLGTWMAHLDQSMIDELVEEHPTVAAQHLGSVGDRVNVEALLAKLLHKREFNTVLKTPSGQFHMGNDELIRRVVEAGGAKNVVASLAGFSGLSKKTFLFLLDTVPTEKFLIYGNIFSFQDLTRKDAVELIKMARSEYQRSAIREVIKKMMDHPSIFDGLSLDRELAEKLLEAGLVYELMMRVQQFVGLNVQHAYRIVEGLGPLYSPAPLIDHASSFEHLVLGKEFALRLLASGYVDILAKKLEKFSALDASLGVGLLYFPEQAALLKSHPQLLPNKDTDAYTRKLWDFHEDAGIPLALRQSKEIQAFVLSSLQHEDHAVDINALSARLSHFLSSQEYLSIAQSAPAALEKSQEGGIDPEAVLLALKNELLRPGEDENIAHMLELGARHFGAEAMLRYMNRADLSRHDALHFMPDIIQVQEQSGLSAQQFANTILLQVAKDGARYYEEGTAHHYFNQVVDALKETDVQAVLTQAKDYSNIESVRVVLEGFAGQSIFSSWKSLKAFYSLNDLVKQSQYLDELSRGEMPEKRRAYLGKLIVNPSVSKDAVVKFWQHTADFLEVDDDHTPEAINRVKKPSNLLSLEYLGLKAEDLRDALIEGELDDLQVLPPMERQYRFGFPDVDKLFQDLRSGIGQERKGVPGRATNPRKLFSEVQAWCKKNQIAWSQLWDEKSGAQVLTALPEVKRGELYDLVFDEAFGIRPCPYTLMNYRIRIGLKSDPDMVIAGNSTACCMPFGSGKNNVYMFNPTYAQLVAERLSDDGRWRTVAQSVMNINHQTDTPTPELVRAYTEKGQSITQLIKPGDLERLPVLTADNIEPSKNEEGDRIQNIREAYQRFMAEYVQEHAKTLGINRTRVVVGANYTPANIGFSSETNTYIPTAPAGYSDNIGQNCFVIETGLPEIERKHQSIIPLRTRDSLAVGVLEGKAFEGVSSLLQGLHRMQYRIMGMEIANRHFDRPNLSFLYRDSKGSPRGYMLAYEGQVQNQRFVFIDDLASDRENKMAGGRLIRQFFEAYSNAYGNGERPLLPIYTNARDSTSYPILMRSAERMAKEKGMLARLVETGTTSLENGESMHNVVVLIGKTEAELDEQAIQMRQVFGEGSARVEEREYQT